MKIFEGATRAVATRAVEITSGSIYLRFDFQTEDKYEDNLPSLETRFLASLRHLSLDLKWSSSQNEMQLSSRAYKTQIIMNF